MKIVFLQNKGGNYGGVWQVNKMVGEGLINAGYDVSIVSIRDDHFGITLEHDPRLKVVTINEKDQWHTYYGKDFKESLKKAKLFTFIKQVFHRIRNNYRLKKDKKKLTDYLDDNIPDYIIVSQYQVLDLLDKKYLPITYCEQHASFLSSQNNLHNLKVFDDYKNKIKGFIWLSKKTCEKAIDYGYKNSVYIYNPVRFTSENIANVVNNKKLVAISRIDREKRIDLMIDIVQEVFLDEKYKDWILEIYGNGEEFDKLKTYIKTDQIKMMGSTNNPKEILLTSSIDLNTSNYEGFPMTILEGYECGVPAISFMFGESVNESIMDKKTGYICKNREEYIKRLKELMDNKELLLELSKNCREYNRRFHIENIIPKWEELFK